MRTLRRFMLAGLITGLAGCGSLTRSYLQDLTIETEPPGATVALSNGRICLSPCTIRVERVAGLTARVSKPGCRDAIRDLPSTFPEGGTALFSLLDYQTGSAAEHRPNPTTIVLTCDAGGPAALSPYDAKTLDLLNGGQDLDVVLTPFDENAFNRQHDHLFPPRAAFPKP